MKKLLQKFLFACIAATSAVSAQATVIDFEAWSVGTVLAANTDLGGVYFNHDIQIWGANQFPPFATGNVALNSTNFADDFSGGFTSTVNSFSLAVGDNCCDLDSATLTVYDAAMNVLGTSSFFNQASGQILSVSAAGIKFFSVDQNSAVVFDNLTFDASTQVPEPASLALFGLALAGMFARRRSPSA
jgi:hypothetical protein